MTTISADQTLVDRAAASMDGSELRLSVVIPVYNEADNVLPLLEEISRALAAYAPFEVIFVDDASSDDTAARLKPAMAAGPCRVRLVRHGVRSGQSAAVRTGVRLARAAWVVTLDGDGQNDPADIPHMLDVALGPLAPALVGGVRRKRRDTLSKRLASRFANAVRQGLLRDGCPDSGCGLKLFRRDIFLDLPYFGAMHRFLPALFKAQGRDVVHVPVNHRPRQRGQSKYTNLRRGLIGIVDLLGVYWLKRRTPAASPVTEE